MPHKILRTALLCVALAPFSPPAFSQTPPAAPAQQLLDSARRAFNEKKFPFAIERFREFLKANPNSPDAPAANFGLGVALLESPDRDFPAALDPLTKAANTAAFPQRPHALYYLGVALKSSSPKSPLTPQRLAESILRLADSLKLLDALSEKLSPDAAGNLPPDLEFALRARTELADAFLQSAKFKEAAATAAPLLDSTKLAKSAPAVPHLALARYQLGLAHFQLNDLLAAGQTLAPLAPFTQDFGLHARYLLARIHHLSNERPNALADYKALLDALEASRNNAREQLKSTTLPPDRRLLLDSLVNTTPDFLLRANFYYASLLAESGKSADALDLLKKFLTANPASSLNTEAQLRLGLLLVQTASFNDALNTLRPLLDDQQFADQALWFSARAQAAIVDPANPQATLDSQKAALDLFRRAAEKSAALFKAGDPSAQTRRFDILLEFTDAQLALKLYKEAAISAATLHVESSAVKPATPYSTARAEESLERHITALHLAALFPESDKLIERFLVTYPKSLLLPSVLFRAAESTYLGAVAASLNPKLAADAPRRFTEAANRYQKLISDFPAFPQLPAARFGYASSLYRLGKFPEAAELCKSISDADRTGDLVAVHYLHGDALLRTLPPEGDDAIATSKMLLHADAAARNLAAFISLAGPKNPQLADASLKLGYIQQRIGLVLADPVERKKNFTQARDAYDKILATTPWENPLAPAASLERAKTLALLDDVAAADRELRRFTVDPGLKAPNAPLAVVRLAALLRSVNKPQEAADLLKQLRDRDEVTLIKDPLRSSWLPLIQYEHALSLQEAGKLEEARTLYNALIAAQRAATPPPPQVLDSLWRSAQCQRLLIANSLAASRLTISRAIKPEEIDAARKTLDASYRALLDWTNSLAPLAEDAAKKSPTAESSLRLSYELAWAYRVLGNAQLEAARAKIQRDQLADILAAAPKNPPTGYALNTGLTPPPTPDSALPLQSMETKSHEAYKRSIALADAASSPLAFHARIELAEILAARGKPDDALDLLTDALEKNPPAPLNDRARVRIAAILLEKGDAKNALAQAGIVLKNLPSPFLPDARYLSGEALLLQNDPPKAIETLTPFRTDARFLNSPDLADKALLRLTLAYAQSLRWDEARQTAELLVQRFPQSPFIDHARYAIAGTFQATKRPEEAIAAYTEITKRSTSETAARAQLQIGLLRREQKKLPEALQALLAVPYTYPYPETNAQAWYNLGLLYLDLKNPAEAQASFQRLLKDHPKSQFTPEAQKYLTILTPNP